MAIVIVDRNGGIDKYHFIKGVPVELPDELIPALGSHVRIVEGAKADEIVSKKAPKSGTKEIKRTLNKMVQKADSNTK